MDTGQLREVLSREFKSSFGGVYPVDLLPDQLRPGEKAVVVNTDPQDRPGEHWVCLYVSNPVVEYFDSYGFPPLQKEIQDFIQRHAQQWTYNPYRYQDWNTDVCGQYCVYYLHQRDKKRKKSDEWLFPFDQSSALQRDRYVANWFKNTYHKLPTGHGQKCQCFYQNVL